MEGAHAHHVLPRAFESTFERAGLNIHDPRFGAWWEGGEHLKNAAQYNREWNRFLSADRSSGEILEFGRRISAKYGLETRF